MIIFWRRDWEIELESKKGKMGVEDLDIKERVGGKN